MTTCIKVSPVDQAVVTVTLDRPAKKNALSIELRDQVSDAMDGLVADERVKVIVITGAGDTFSAGFDLSEFSDDEASQRRLWASSDRFHHTVMRCPLPVVAAVNGPALAGGFDLAILCDIRIAAVTARFAHPEQAWSDVVFSPLHDLVGGAIARDLCLTGRSIDAAEAHQLGLVSTVVSAQELAAEAARTARSIARAPRPSLMRTKAKALARGGLPPGTATLDL